MLLSINIPNFALYASIGFILLLCILVIRSFYVIIELMNDNKELITVGEKESAVFSKLKENYSIMVEANKKLWQQIKIRKFRSIELMCENLIQADHIDKLTAEHEKIKTEKDITIQALSLKCSLLERKLNQKQSEIANLRDDSF